MRKTDTKEKALKEGMSLLQKRGYNGFSFQDIADKIKIKKPSLYDHFSTKDDLVLSIIKLYNSQFDSWTKKVSVLTPLQRIRSVFDVFESFSKDKRKVCPVLSLSADQDGLDRQVKKEVELFVSKWLTWLSAQIREGQLQGVIRKDIKATDLASFIYSQGIGVQFQARIQNNEKLIPMSGDFLIQLIEP